MIWRIPQSTQRNVRQVSSPPGRLLQNPFLLLPLGLPQWLRSSQEIRLLSDIVNQFRDIPYGLGLLAEREIFLAGIIYLRIDFLHSRNVSAANLATFSAFFAI